MSCDPTPCRRKCPRGHKLFELVLKNSCGVGPNFFLKRLLDLDPGLSPDVLPDVDPDLDPDVDPDLHPDLPDLDQYFEKSLIQVAGVAGQEQTPEGSAQGKPTPLPLTPAEPPRIVEQS